MNHPDFIEGDVKGLVAREVIAAAEYGRLICVRHGMLWYCLIPGTAASVEIVAVAVDKAHRGKGVGSSLLAYLFEAVPHATRIVAWAEHDSDTAKFLIRNGFGITKTRGIHGAILFRRYLTDRETDE